MTTKRQLINDLEASPCRDFASVTVWTACKCGLSEHFIYGIEDSYIQKPSSDDDTGWARLVAEGRYDIVDLGVSDDEGDSQRTLKLISDEEAAALLEEHTDYRDVPRDYYATELDGPPTVESLKAAGFRLVREVTS